MRLRTLLGAGTGTSIFALSAIMLAGPAAAQQATIEPGETEAAEAEPGDTIVVTGFRQALETAIDLKRDSPVIAEAFSAEDIGKLPDVSIAETLGRLPGLAVQRIDGRAQSLSIRGLGPDYSTSLLNGRQLVSSGDNRGVEYDQYPSELINSGVIYKVPFAGLIGQGLAGTVDLRTIRPLDARERIISLSARAEFNEDGSLNPDIEGWGYRATGTYVDQFADDTLGVAVGVAYQSSPSQVKRFNSWGYPELGEGDVESGNAPAGSEGTLVLGGMKPFARSVDLDRLGVFGTLEYEPSDYLSTSIDVFYADYQENIPQRGIEFPLNPGWGAGTRITAVSPVGQLADTATFTGVQPVVRNDFDRKETETYAIGWNTQYEAEDVLLLVDIAYSRSDRRLQQIESYSGIAFEADPDGPSDVVTYTRNSNGFPFTFTNQIDYSDTSLVRLTDPRGWGANDIVQAGFINDTSTEDDLWSVRAEAAFPVNNGWLGQVVIGAAYDNRTKSRDIEQNFLSLAGGPSAIEAEGAVTSLPIPADALLEPTDTLGFLGIGPQVTYDPFDLINNGTYIFTRVEGSGLPIPGDWEVNEKVHIGYARLDLDVPGGAIPLTGNIGVQFVLTDQSSTGFDSRGLNFSQPEPTEGGARYLNVLPSATLNFEVSDEITVRLGAARTLARPRMDQLNASSNTSIGNTLDQESLSIFGGTGGNPELRPYLADGIDLSAEWYFAEAGYLAVATYYKWLDDFVNPNAQVIRDFSYLVPLLTPSQLNLFNATGGQTLGVVSGPDNAADGYIFGVEATLAVPLDVFSSALEGFGFQTSVAYTDDKLEIQPQEGDPFETDIPGLSEWVVNSTAYFERWGFEARLSHRYRTEFLAEFPGISANRIFRKTEVESIFDAQIGYRFEAGSLEGLSITLQALNITDEPFISFQNDDADQIIDYEEYGRTYLVGASYRF